MSSPTFAPDAASAASLRVPMLEALGEIVDEVVEKQKAIAALQAEQAVLIDRARQWAETTAGITGSDRGGWSPEVIAHKTVVTELAVALRLPERTVERLVAESRSLVHELPATRQSLADGHISYRHAQKLVEHAWSLPVEARHHFEDAVLPAAEKLTVAKFDAKARTVRERTHPDSIQVRHEQSVQQRHVDIEPDRGGVLQWTSPTGRIYTTHPETHLPT
jgi:hypothetical protein